MHRRIRLDCQGKTTGEVLQGLLKEFESAGNGRRIVLLVENVQRINDSLCRLLQKLVAFFNERKIRASIVDPSGCTGTLFRALGGSVHVEVCSNESEIGRPMDILVVEDTEDSRDFVKELLESAGHTVTLARTGREALKTCEKKKFDLILLDLVLPDIDGIAVARSLPVHRPIVVAMSAYLDKFDEREFRGAGIHLSLRKPFQTHELLAALR